MDAERFDTLTRGLTRARSRRGALAALLGGTLGLLGGLLPGRGAVPVRAGLADELLGDQPVFNYCASQGLTDCGGYCADTLFDPNNCGFCGNFCSLVDGLNCCSGVCVNTSIDAFNCGGCGNSCPLGGFCQGGFCTGLLCPDGLVDCRVGYCVNLLTDNSHCGGCRLGCFTGSTCQNGIRCD